MTEHNSSTGAGSTDRPVVENPIRDDRQLLDELNLTDAEAASFLGKSRQALNGQLGSKRSREKSGPFDYFKVSDIVILVSAARQVGRVFDVARISEYVFRTRPRRGDEPGVPFELLDNLLFGETSAIDVAQADTVVFMLPAFADLCAHRPDARDALVKIAKQLRSANPRPNIFVLSSTPTQAKMVAQWFDLDLEEDHCFGDEIVDHYLPTVLTYNQNSDIARPYVLTENGTFVEAPQFRAPMMVQCVRSLLPNEVSRALRPDHLRAA